MHAQNSSNVFIAVYISHIFEFKVEILSSCNCMNALRAKQFKIHELLNF